MTELMVRPGRANAFRRTVKLGKSKTPKLLVFPIDQPVTVTDAEYLELAPEIGIVLFEIERDEKGRIRYVEAVASPTRSTMEMPVVANL